MPVSPDITDPIPYALSNPSSGGSFANTTVHYDVAIGGQPFFLQTTDETPYRRVTAQYRKQQLDTTREPGEQTLTGWWLRSQSSFHLGQGVKFFEPQQDESLRFQYTNSKGCNVWNKGQVTFLKEVNSYHAIESEFQTDGKPFQSARSIQWGSTNGILLWDGYDVDKIAADGTATHFIDYTAPTDAPVYAICDDGTYAYWVTNNTGTGKLEMLKKLLTLDSSTPGTSMFIDGSVSITKGAVLEFTKERLVLTVDNKVYELSTTATALPAAVYTHPTNDFVYTSITSSGSAIYVTGYSGIRSTIQKFTLTTAGAMPTLTSAITAAELPVGEIIYKIYYYLGFMAIGTSLGLRMAAVSDTDGSVAYGPLIFESEHPVYDVAAYDKFLWATTNVDGNPGVTRINLGQEITSLVFAYAWDLYDPTKTGFKTTACAFIGDTNRLAFVTANNGTTDGKVFIESSTDLVEQAEIRIGFIRYNTLEDKIFKLMTPRFDTTDGGIQISSIDSTDTFYNLGSFDQGSVLDQIGIPYPAGPQQYLGFRFTMTRSATDPSKGPIFTGYQVNTLPSIPRQRLIQYPVMLYDYEMDKFQNPAGYEGGAYDRMKTLEDIENIGDTVRIDDFRTNESYLGLIEEMDFTNKTPTDKRFSGYGGVLLVTIRSI